MDNKFYTVEEVAKKLNVSTKTIRRYIASGKLSGVKVGGQWRIEIDVYNKFVGQECCSSDDDKNISKDDFCVFMDTDYFTSADKLQVCSIVDYYVDGNDQVKEISNIILETINQCDDINKSETRFNYVYDQENQRARFVLWGSPSMLGNLLLKLKRFE